MTLIYANRWRIIFILLIILSAEQKKWIEILCRWNWMWFRLWGFDQNKILPMLTWKLTETEIVECQIMFSNYELLPSLILSCDRWPVIVVNYSNFFCDFTCIENISNIISSNAHAVHVCILFLCFLRFGKCNFADIKLVSVCWVVKCWLVFMNHGVDKRVMMRIIFMGKISFL